ncbi:MAG TPA: DUF1800 domain-containing protein [Bryobacteraceae bacterium]|nr:DUF1800 domain-containing protein [Bryobacteraceae bacterium]
MKPRKTLAVLSLALFSLSPGLAKKPSHPTSHPPVPQMILEQKALHALNRLTFGPRPGDVQAVQAMGLDRWIEQQLHPNSIPENPVLETKLVPFDTLRMSMAEMVRHYPTPQMVRAMVDGRQQFPSDADARYLLEKLIDRVKRQDVADKSGQSGNPDVLNAKSIPQNWQLDDQQQQILQSGKPPEQAALLESMPLAEQYDVLDSLPNNVRQRLYAAAQPDLRRRIQIFNGPVQVVNQDLIDGKLMRAIYSSRQLEEVLTDFWYNHFNVFLDKGADRYMVTAYERDVIRPHVLGHFKDLLVATAESPAMLFFLDNWQSRATDPKAVNANRQGLNENYGRELMELHTLGVDGGYTQQDVTEVARCFTGWTISEPRRGGGFEFNEKIHDKGEKHLLGVTIPAGGGMNDGLKVLDILAHHPSTARFISKSLAIRFVSDDPPASLVEKMAKTYEKTDGDLLEVMRTMLSAPEFWDPANFRSKVKSPLEMVASAVRAINGDVDFAQALAGQLNQLGEPLYRKLEPTGYSNRGADWMNSASLLARMNFGIALAQGKIQGVKVDPAQFALSIDPLRIERNILMTDASPSARDAIQTGLDQQQQLGAMAAGLTLGSPDFQRR